MPWLTASMKWIMLVAGLLTATMFQATFDPQAVLRKFFGEGLEGPVAEIVVRNWGALIGMVGVLLVVGAFVKSARRIALLLGAASKTVFIVLVLTYGRQYLGAGAQIPVVVDAVMVLLFVLHLLTWRPRPA